MARNVINNFPRQLAAGRSCSFFFLHFTPKNALQQKVKFNWLLPDSFVVRVAMVSNPLSNLYKIKTHPKNSRWVFILYGWSGRILFSSLHSEKRLVTRYAIQGISPPTHSSSVSLRFRIHLLHPYFSKPPSFQKRAFQNIWLEW